MIVFPDGSHYDHSFFDYVKQSMKDQYGDDFQTFQLQGYALREYTADNPPEFNHMFCGPQNIPGADCPNCHKPLLQMMALDTRDERLGLSHYQFQTLPLLFCFTCQITEDHFYYQVDKSNGSVNILEYRKGVEDQRSTSFYPETYPIHLPGMQVELLPFTIENQWYVIEGNAIADAYSDAINQYDDALIEQAGERESQFLQKYHKPYYPGGDQVGGFPELVRDWDEWANRCPVCHKSMAFLATFDDESTDPHGFLGNSALQYVFTLCKDCCVVGASVFIA